MLNAMVALTTRVGLVSPEPIRLAGLASVFDDHATIRLVVGELDRLLADVTLRYLILDVSPDSHWIETQYRVRRLRPDIRQIVLGPPGSDELILRSLAAGGRAYLDTNSGPHSIRLAVEAVIQGSIWAPRRLLSVMIDRLLSQPGSLASHPPPELSPRERQVLELIMTARSNREIGEELGIEERTVKAYVSSLMRKTGADNRVALTMQAINGSLMETRVSH